MDEVGNGGELGHDDLAAIESFMLGNGQFCKRFDATTIVTWLGGVHARFDIMIKALLNQPVLTVTIRCPVTLPEESHSRIALFISPLNSSLRLGKIHLRPGSGELTLNAAIPSGEDFRLERFLQVMRMYNHLDYCFPSLMRLAYGDADPFEELECLALGNSGCGL